MKRKVIATLIVNLILSVCFIVIPLLINECYKANTGYTTVWDGADVLGYYGTIISSALGTIVTIFTVYITISFTQKQIQRETYLKDEQEKWGKVENMVARALEQINPKRILLVATETLANDDKNYLNSVLSAIQKYQFDCRVATDYLYSYMGSIEYSRVETLLNKLQNAAKEFYDIAQKEFDLYQLIRDNKARDATFRLIKNEALLPNILTDDERILAFRILDQTKGSDIDAIYAELEKTNAKMVTSYETVFRPLLTLKKQNFDIIYTELQKNADEILHFKRKK